MRTDDELVLGRIREVLRDPDLYDPYNSVTTRCLIRDIKNAMGLPLTGVSVPDPEKMSAPYEGQIIYYGKDATYPRRVVRIEGTTIWTVPMDTDVKSTHKGNVYNEKGEHEWAE